MPDNKSTLHSTVVSPARVTFLDGQNDLNMIEINTRWSNAEIYCHGAHVTQFRKKGEPPLLFMSQFSRFADGQPIRGGIPIIFPWFGMREGFRRFMQKVFLPAYGHAIHSFVLGAAALFLVFVMSLVLLVQLGIKIVKPTSELVEFSEKLIGGDIGPELTKVGSKVNLDWLVSWLRDPESYLPHAQMPRYEWSEEDIYKLTKYVTTKLTVRPVSRLSSSRNAAGFSPIMNYSI